MFLADNDFAKVQSFNVQIDVRHHDFGHDWHLNRLAAPDVDVDLVFEQRGLTGVDLEGDFEFVVGADFALDGVDGQPFNRILDVEQGVGLERVLQDERLHGLAADADRAEVDFLRVGDQLGLRHGA